MIKTLRGPSIELCLGTKEGLIFGVMNCKLMILKQNTNE